jgi:hypothetical protein
MNLMIYTAEHYDPDTTDWTRLGKPTTRVDAIAVADRHHNKTRAKVRVVRLSPRLPHGPCEVVHSRGVVVPRWSAQGAGPWAT